MEELQAVKEERLRDVFVFQICEYDAVAGHTLEEAKCWYKELTGLGDDELYSDEEIEIVSFDYEVWNDEERTEIITVREIVDIYWSGEPFIAITTCC